MINTKQIVKDFISNVKKSFLVLDYDTFTTGYCPRLESLIVSTIAQALAEDRERLRVEIKKPLEIVADFVERWNKQDKEKEVAQAIETLLSIKSKNIWN